MGVKVGGDPNPMHKNTNFNVASLIPLANGYGELLPALMFCRSDTNWVLAAAMVVMVVAADGEVSVSKEAEPSQAMLVTVPGVMMDAVMAEAMASANGSIQELFDTGGKTERAAINIGWFKVKISAVPPVACTESMKFATTLTKLVIPTKGILAVGIDLMLLDRISMEGSILLASQEL